MQDFTPRLAALRAEPSSDAAHDGPRLARVERTRAELMVQGDAIAATLAAERGALDAIARLLAGRALRQIVILGCGDSWFVGMAARYAFEAATGIPARGEEAHDFAHHGGAALDARTLAIGLSASGTTDVVRAALAKARARGAFTIGVSNVAGSALGADADAALVVHATRRGWPTQSSTAAMALLASLAATLGDARQLAQDLSALPPSIDALLLALDEEARRVAATIADADLMLFTGAGPHFATAAFGAAKIRELGPIHAFASPLEEMHHYRAQKAGDVVVMVTPDAASRERALDTALVGEAAGSRIVALLGVRDDAIESRVGAVLRVPPCDPALAPILHAPALHLLAYHFAKARDARGLGAARAIAS